MGRRRGTNRRPANPELRRSRGGRVQRPVTRSQSSRGTFSQRQNSSRGRPTYTNQRQESQQQQQQLQAVNAPNPVNPPNPAQGRRQQQEPQQQQNQLQENQPNPGQGRQVDRHRQLVDALFEGQAVQDVNTGERTFDSSLNSNRSNNSSNVGSSSANNSNTCNNNSSNGGPSTSSGSGSTIQSIINDSLDQNPINRQSSHVSTLDTGLCGMNNSSNNMNQSSYINSGMNSMSNASQNVNSIGMFNMNNIGVNQENAPNALISICNPLGCELPQSLKSKIIKGEYVDFGVILGRSEYQLNQTRSMTLSINQGGQIVWQDDKIKRPITTIHNWTTAFLIYASIYLSAHPQRSQELLKYAHVVRTAASRYGGYAWRSYDVQFRLRQEQHPQRSWSVIDGELWSFYMTSPMQMISHAQLGNGQSGGVRFPRQSDGFRFTSQNAFKSKQSQPLQPFQNKTKTKGVCFDFNRQSGCSRSSCMYKHLCFKCNETGHGLHACKKGNK